jgi:tRNA(adenine34) deaminase
MEEKFMSIALKQAKIAYDNGETPVGAVVVFKNKIIAKAHNMRENSGDPIGHAEIIAIKKACKKIGDWRLNECLLFVNMEPCIMCMGLIIESRIKRVYCSIPNEKYKDSLNFIIITNKLDIQYGIFEDESKELLKNFFQSKRKK